jgi:hypothetical protein
VYAGDAVLKLWSGLLLLAGGRPVLALIQFHQARRLGLDQWRLDWHLARAAQAANAPELAALALARVRQAAPDFRPAQPPDAAPQSAP